MQTGDSMAQQAAMQPLMQLSSFVQSGNTASQPLQASIGDMLSYLSIKHSGSGGGGGGGKGGNAVDKILGGEMQLGLPTSADGNPGARDAIQHYVNNSQQMFNQQLWGGGW
jgi:hypothetical protein